MRTDQGGRHLDDGDLFRLLDGECPSQEANSFRHHLATCPKCAQRAEEFAAHTRAFANLITRAGPLRIAAPRADRRSPALTRQRTPWWNRRLELGVAAAILLLLSAALAVPPARAWLANRWSQLTGSSAPAPDVERTIPGDTALGPERAAVVFTPRQPRVRVEVASHQRTGTLRVVIEPGTSAVASIRGGRGTEEFILFSDGVRIANAESSTATYVVSLPPTFSSVSIVVAGREVGSIPIRRDGPSITREFQLRRD